MNQADIKALENLLICWQRDFLEHKAKFLPDILKYHCLLQTMSQQRDINAVNLWKVRSTLEQLKKLLEPSNGLIDNDIFRAISTCRNYQGR